MQKGGLFPQDRGADVASRADVARGTRADAMRHARPPVKAERGPRGEPEWPKLTRTRGRGHASPRGRPRGHHVASGEAGIWRAHGLVGPGEIIGPVTQMRTAPLPFIRANFFIFLRVGLSSREFYFFAGDVAASRALDAIAGRRSRGPESTRSSSGHVR